MKTRCLALLFVCALILGSGLPPGTAAAAPESPVHTVVLQIDSPYCALGERITLVDGNNMEVAPVIMESRTMLPIRMLLEAFHGSVSWDGDARQITCSLGDHSAVLRVDASTAWVDGTPVSLDVPATIRNDRTLTPLRFVSESLSLQVGWDPEYRLVTVSDRALPADLKTLPEVQALLTALYGSVPGAPEPTNMADPVSLLQKTFSLPSGLVSANVVTVDLTSPRVRVEARLTDGQLGHTAPFSSIVTESGADVVINANFFNSYDAYQRPIGSLISNGSYLFSEHGLTSLGFNEDNQVFWGNSSYVEIGGGDSSTRSYLVNYLSSSEVYTPACGASVTAPSGGSVLIAAGGAVTAYRAVTAGEEISIPADGFVFFKNGLNFRTGDPISLQAFMSAENGTQPRISQMISGGPRLIKDGEIFTELTTGFDGPNFTTLSAPRTAVGTTVDGKLLLVNALSATVQQLRELMEELRCENAVNLDGGASAAMYYRGQTICPPGRPLTCTLHVFLDQ